MKKIFLAILFLISLAASSQQQYYDFVKAKHYLDVGSKIQSVHSMNASGVLLLIDSLTDEIIHRSISAISLSSFGAPTGNISMGSNKITNLSDGTSGTDAVNLNQLNALSAGVTFKQAVQYGTDAALAANTYNNGTSGVGATLTGNANGALSVDGSTPSVGDRILVKNEATTANNGVYVVTTVGDGSNPYVLTRSTDFDQSADITSGSAAFVINGTANANKIYGQTTTGTITVGTTAISFTQIGGGSGGGLGDPGGNGFVDRTSLNTTAARTLTGTTNRLIITNGGGGGNPVFDVGSNIVDKSAATTYTAGAKQTFTPDATNSGFKFGGVTANPSSLSAGDVWFRSDNGKLTYYNGATTQSVVAEDFAQALTNKTFNLTNNTLTGTKAQFDIALSDGDFASLAGSETLTNKRITKRTGTTTSSATPTINTDNVDFYSITAQSGNITSMSTNLSGSPTEGQTLWIALTATSGTPTITWGASFEASTIPLPTALSTTRQDCLFVWNTVTTRWRIVANQ